MHKLISNDLPPPFDAIFEPAPIAKYNLRNNENLKLSMIRLASTERTIRWMGPKIWNQIPSDIKKKKYNTFKKLYSDYLHVQK